MQLYLSSGDDELNVTGVVYTPVTGLVIEPTTRSQQLVYEFKSEIIFVARVDSGDHLTFSWSTTATGVQVIER